MIRLAGVAETGCKIGRSNEQIDIRNGRQFFNLSSGTPSTAITLSQAVHEPDPRDQSRRLYTNRSCGRHYGDIFATDSINSSVDLDCLASTNNAATALASFCQGNGFRLHLQGELHPQWLTAGPSRIRLRD
jgi:hypothetical protein